MTERHAATVGVRKSNVSRIINKHLDLGEHFLQKERAIVEENAKQLLELIKFILRRQVKTFKEIYWLLLSASVSYTHLDVYKRQQWS